MGSVVRGWIFGLLLAGCMPRPSADPAPMPEAPSCAPEEAAFVYRRRIAPLIADDRPASCNQCHLQGIDLSAFVRADACTSMACLLSKDMVDFEAPEDSKILGLIDRARGGPTPEIAEEEHAGFLAWIRYSARCHAKACGEIANACEPPLEPEPVIDQGPPDRGVDAAVVELDAGVADAGADQAVFDAQPPDMRRLAVVPDHLEPCSPGQLITQFQWRVMRWKGRCNHCHADDGLTRGIRGAPLWMVDRSDFEAARQTAQRVLERGYVNLEAPAESLVLVKPLHRRYGGIEHGGGNKFTRDTDPAYLDFKDWVEAVARCGVPELEGLAPPPDMGTPDAGVSDGGRPPHDAGPMRPDDGRPRPLSDYCNCMLTRCHDTYHRLWGEDDTTARVVCLQRAARLEDVDLACRRTVCETAPERPDGSEDAVLCAGAVGDGLCE